MRLIMNWYQFGLQDGLSPAMEELIYFHDYLMMILIYILSVVMFFLAMALNPKYTSVKESSNQVLEFAWTVIPSIILVAVAMPSLSVLYWMEDFNSHTTTLKVVGHQWYWSYEFTDLEFEEEFLFMDSYIMMEGSKVRNLETDNMPLLPYQTPVRVIVGSSDVLHSWAVPSLGVKVDANPGRLNQSFFSSSAPGVVYGQCSEICGANHSFMPIAIEFVMFKDFYKWQLVNLKSVLD